MELSLMGLTVVILLFAGFPIAVVLGLTGIAWTWAYGSSYLPGIAHTAFNTMASETLIAVPLFLLMGQIVQKARIAERFYNSLAHILIGLPGGLLHANVLACGIFSAVSGSSVATASTIATAAVPSQTRLNYNPRLTAGSLAAGGTLGILIPPSIPLIIYCSLIEESIGLVFIAAIAPAFLLLAMFHLYIFMRALVDPTIAPLPENISEAEDRSNLLWDALPLTVIILSVLITIYMGWMTASEAAAGGVAVSLVVALLGKSLTIPRLTEAAVESVRLTAMLLFIIVGAQLFSYAVFTWGFNTIVSDLVASVAWPPAVILLILALIYLVLGMFVDAISLLLMTVPVVHPIILQLGYDPIWFGVVLVLLLEVGLITPPVGMNLFAIKAVAHAISLKDISFGALPFVFLMLMVAVLLSAFPQLALWLPFSR